MPSCSCTSIRSRRSCTPRTRVTRRRIVNRWMALALAAAMTGAGPAWAGDMKHKEPTPEQKKEADAARAGPEEARQELEKAAKELVRASEEVGVFSPRAFAYEFLANPRRGMMGVIIDDGPMTGDEIHGIEVKAVTPGGGADKAGIKAGDVVVSV